MAKPDEQAKAGVANLVRNCAEVSSSDTIVVASDETRVESDVIPLIVEAIQMSGGKATTVYFNPDDKKSTEHAVAAARGADKLILSAMSVAPFLNLGGGQHPRLIVCNFFHSLTDFATAHASFHWQIANEIYRTVERMFVAGSNWRIVTPTGTNLSGIIGDRSARSSYLEDETPEYVRYFNSRAYCPVAADAAVGTIACQFTHGPRRTPCIPPPILIFEDNDLKEITGPDDARGWIRELQSGWDDVLSRFGEAGRALDSWHGGANPKAELAPTLLGNGSTRNMHFHIGRTTGRSGDYISAEISDYSLWVNERCIFDRGRLAILNDAPILAAFDRFGLRVPV